MRNNTKLLVFYAFNKYYFDVRIAMINVTTNQMLFYVTTFVPEKSAITVVLLSAAMFYHYHQHYSCICVLSTALQGCHSCTPPSITETTSFLLSILCVTSSFHLLIGCQTTKNRFVRIFNWKTVLRWEFIRVLRSGSMGH